MTQKERLVYFINRINSDEELKEEIYNKCDPDTIYPQKELMEDLEWLMEGGSEENYDLVPFANDGSGGLYLLVNDQHIAYFDSEGCAGYVAESVDDFFNILFVFRFFCLSKGVMKSYEQFLKECEEDLFEIKPSEAFEIGIGQEDEVMRLMIQHGFKNVRCRKDLCGVYRCVSGFYEK